MPKKTSSGLQFGRQRRREREPQRQLRQRAQDLDHPLDDVVDPAAEIAGDAAEEEPEGERHGDADEPDGERDARAVDDAREQVAPEPVGAERGTWCRRSAGSTRCTFSRTTAPEVVGVAAAEEADRLRLPCGPDDVVALEGLEVEGELVRIDERPDEAPFVEQVQALRRRVQEVAVPLGLVVGRDHLDERHHQVEGEQQERGGDGDLVAPELPPHQPPRGRAVELLALRADRLAAAGIERGGVDVMLRRRPRRSRQRPPTRMRGSSQASKRSETSMPTTVSTATNIRMKPARNWSWLSGRRAGSGRPSAG